MVTDMDSFWRSLPRPFFALAPMEDVTDCASRRLIAEIAPPHVMWTEFVSADGLVRADEPGMRRLRKKLSFTEQERPIVAQLFSAHPAYIEQAARICAELGFDGIDINMGCPDRSVEKQKSGSGMIKFPELAVEIIRAAKRGAGSVPVSVKTRIGYAHEEIDTWLLTILREDVAALTVHLRTRNELSLVPAHWDHMPRIVALRNTIAPQTLLIGNGDVTDIADATHKARESGCDGVMLGRAVFGDPWLFAAKDVRDTARDPRVRMAMLVRHIDYFREALTGIVSDAVMKKHFKAYISGWHGAADLRVRLMDAPDLAAARAILIDELHHD